MATTPNLGLHQWAAGDAFLRTDFNTDFGKIDTAVGSKGQVACGSYKGSGDMMTQANNTVLNQTIPLPFTPRAVFVCQQVVVKTGNIPSLGGGTGITTEGVPMMADSFELLKIIPSGFVAGCARMSNGSFYYPILNLLNATYLYMAIR